MGKRELKLCEELGSERWKNGKGVKVRYIEDEMGER